MSDARTEIAGDDDGSRRLTRYYILALSAVALLSIAGQFFVQSQLVDQLGDSKLVNMAGRQRMLSQRIVKCA
ncbi:MAG: type IV pili methyl-accepting chemotaxis transducer N-terminal domain-containing protein [Pirellulales bacterium]